MKVCGGEQNESNSEREKIGRKCREANQMNKSQVGCFKGEYATSEYKVEDGFKCNELQLKILLHGKEKRGVPTVTSEAVVKLIYYHAH